MICDVENVLGGSLWVLASSRERHGRPWLLRMVSGLGKIPAAGI